MRLEIISSRAYYNDSRFSSAVFKIIQPEVFPAMANSISGSGYLFYLFVLIKIMRLNEFLHFLIPLITCLAIFSEKFFSV